MMNLKYFALFNTQQDFIETEKNLLTYILINIFPLLCLLSYKLQAKFKLHKHLKY